MLPLGKVPRPYGTGASEEELTNGSDDRLGTETDGTAVVSTTLAEGSALSGATTGFECGGGVTRTAEAPETPETPDGRPRTTRTADDEVVGENSMGG
ncbi:hypothetical protein [Lentzea sp. NPDC004782]|uniref:hypothetical protein n=1 Tax=Lentzea sp. NPDC004782 TaxID=3154458 RepID=UPI0033BB73CC